MTKKIIAWLKKTFHRLTKRQKIIFGLYGLTLLAAGIFISTQVFKAEVIGTIQNTASLNYTDSQGSHNILSNTLETQVLGDITPPTGTIKINNDAPKVTGGTAVTLNLSATDNNGTVQAMKFTNNYLAGNPPTTKWSPYEAYQTTRTNWNLADDRYGGSPCGNPFSTKTVWVKFRDPSGNESTGEIKDPITCLFAPTPTPTPLD